MCGVCAEICVRVACVWVWCVVGMCVCVSFGVCDCVYGVARCVMVVSVLFVCVVFCVCGVCV